MCVCVCVWREISNLSLLSVFTDNRIYFIWKKKDRNLDVWTQQLYQQQNNFILYFNYNTDINNNVDINNNTDINSCNI